MNDPHTNVRWGIRGLDRYTQASSFNCSQKCQNAAPFSSTQRTATGVLWHKAMVLVCLPLAAPIGLSPLRIPTHC